LPRRSLRETGTSAAGGGSPGGTPAFSRGAIFSIDEVGMTASVAWQYLLNAYSFWGGNVVALQNGDIEICASEPKAIDPGLPARSMPRLMPGGNCR
jgi:hypothetical protein